MLAQLRSIAGKLVLSSRSIGQSVTASGTAQATAQRRVIAAVHLA